MTRCTTTLNTLIEQIARQHLAIDTLEPPNNGNLDFHDVSAPNLSRALHAAYQAGLAAARHP